MVVVVAMVVWQLKGFLQLSWRSGFIGESCGIIDNWMPVVVVVVVIAVVVMY